MKAIVAEGTELSPTVEDHSSTGETQQQRVD